MNGIYNVFEVTSFCQDEAPSHVWEGRFTNRDPDRLEVYCEGCGAKFPTPWAWDGPEDERFRRIEERIARYSDCRVRIIKWIHAM